MPALNLLTLFALASVAIVTLSSGPLHAHALVADRAQVARHVHAHDAIAKRKRSDSSAPSASGRCKPRPSSSLDTSLPTSTSAPPPPTSTTSSSAPSATPSTTSCGSKKWGLAWGSGNQYLNNFATLPKVGYLYEWDENLPSTLSDYPAVQGIPMLWGPDDVDAFAAKVIAGYADIAFGFNEPNEPSQSNMDPSYAAILWQQYMNPLKQLGYTIGSPACTADAAGTQWYQDFFAACAGNCTVDFVTTHFYTPNFQDIIDYSNMLHDTYGKPIWITETADNNFSGTGGQPDMDEVWDWAGKLVDFVDGTDWICGCFPFGALTDLQNVNENNRLLDPATGNPTPLGYYYFGNPS